MEENKTDIIPTTTIYNLLESYPTLEKTLIDMAPPFKKLRNPILRNTVAKVATLKQAAAVGKIDLNKMISNLRKEAGLASLDISFENENYLQEKPKWFSTEKITLSIDESKIEDENKMPVTLLLQKASKLKDEEILELITSFLPAPGIDVMKNKNYETWTTKKGDDLYQSYFKKKTASNKT